MRHEAVDLAVIGAGPAGLSAALAAVQSGVESVVVFEREDEIGGAVRHCGHLGFGMMDYRRLWTGPRYADVLRGASVDLDIRTAHAVTDLDAGGRLTVSTPDGPLAVDAARVLLATGIRETPRSARLVSGARPFGILTTGALQRFVYLHGRSPCRRPVVIGTELVSFSTLLTLRHVDVEPAAILGETQRLETNPLIGLASRTFFGVPVRTGVTLLRIEGDDKVEGVTIEREGRRQTIACDAVIFTGRWTPESALMRLHPAGVDPVTSGPVVDESLRTADPMLYAAGNVRYAVRSSGACALEGRRAGRLIAESLLGPAAPS